MHANPINFDNSINSFVLFNERRRKKKWMKRRRRRWKKRGKEKEFGGNLAIRLIRLIRLLRRRPEEAAALHPGTALADANQMEE